MEIEHSEYLIAIMLFLLAFISGVCIWANKYWGPGGIVEKEQEKYK